MFNHQHHHHSNNNNNNVSTATASSSSTTFKSETVKKVASQLQRLVDRFRAESGLIVGAGRNNNNKMNKSQQHQQQLPLNFSYEDVLRKLKFSLREINREMQSIISFNNNNTTNNNTNSIIANRSEELAITELCRQTKKSIEVDVQRIVSRWLREFIDQHKSEDVEETFKTFARILDSFQQPSTADYNINNSRSGTDVDDDNNNGAATNKASQQHLQIEIENMISSCAAPQLLDATLQWLLPRCVKRYSKAKQIILKLKNNQKKLLEISKIVVFDESAASRKQQDDNERSLAQSRVLLSDFHTNAEMIIQQIMNNKNSMANVNNSNISNNTSHHQSAAAEHEEQLIILLDRLTMTLNKFSQQMRENLTAISINKNQQQQQSDSSLSSSSSQQQQQRFQQARKSLAEFISALNYSNHNENNINPESSNAAGANDQSDLVSFLNEYDDDVVVEIKPSHFEKKRETEERDFFDKVVAANSSSMIMTMMNASGTTSVSAAQQQQQQKQKQKQKQYFDEDGNFVLGPADNNNNNNSRISNDNNNDNNNNNVVSKLQNELRDAQDVINRSHQIGEDREVVIHKLQQNLSRLSSLVEYFATNNTKIGGGGGAKVDLQQQMMMMLNSSTTAGGGGFRASSSSELQIEVEHLRSQLSISEERLAMTQTSLEEHILREEALKREVETLQAGEGLLKNELSYHQTALKAVNDDLIVAQTSLFEVKDRLSRCEESRQKYVDSYQRLMTICVADRRFATQLANQNKHMSQQLEQSVLLSHVEEMLLLQQNQQ